MNSYKRLVVIVCIGFLLRVVALDRYPIALYADEAVFGYNAYLLLNTGRDEWGRVWPVSLQSFGDWKPPMQAWLAIPFVKMIGLNEWAVRMPSAMLGSATIIVLYFLTREFIKRSDLETRSDLSTLSALLLATSPWHIAMSRMAMLVAIEVFFISVGVLGLLKGLRNSHWWLISAGSFSAAIYSYYGSRVTVPLILIIFFLLYRKEIWEKRRAIAIPLLIGVVSLFPLLVGALREPLVLTGRAKTTSVFFNDNVRLQLWDAHTKAGLKGVPPPVSRAMDNKLYYYARDIISRYASHFSPSFLFFRGDSHPPFKIPRLGVVHLADLPFFLVGLWIVRKLMATPNQRRGMVFLAAYLFIAPVVASLTFLTPAANRSFNLVIPWTIITAIGIATIFSSRIGHRATRYAIVLFYAASFIAYTYAYIVLIPRETPRQWQYGRKQLVETLRPLFPLFETVVMSQHGGPPYIALAFFLQIPPDEFHRTVVRDLTIDELGWEHVEKILNVSIPRVDAWDSLPRIPGALYVGFERELPVDQVDILDRVYYPDGTVSQEIGVLKYWVHTQ